MSLQDFSGLLQAARTEAEPQRLLLVFASAELPADATAEEKLRFEQGAGGALAPVLCADKIPEDIHDFAALTDESRLTGIDWDILFIAAMSGRGGYAPSSDEAAQPLRLMVEAIKGGQVGGFLAVDRNGDFVQLERR